MLRVYQLYFCQYLGEMFIGALFHVNSFVIFVAFPVNEKADNISAFSLLTHAFDISKLPSLLLGTWAFLCSLWLAMYRLETEAKGSTLYRNPRKPYRT